MMPSDVPGLNLYFLVSMEPMPGGKTLNCGLVEEFKKKISTYEDLVKQANLENEIELNHIFLREEQKSFF